MVRSASLASDAESMTMVTIVSSTAWIQSWTEYSLSAHARSNRSRRLRTSFSLIGSIVRRPRFLDDPGTIAQGDLGPRSAFDGGREGRPVSSVGEQGLAMLPPYSPVVHGGLGGERTLVLVDVGIHRSSQGRGDLTYLVRRKLGKPKGPIRPIGYAKR